MDLKELQWFIEILNCGSLSNAAQKLNTTQPTLTRTIQKLEQEFGTRLIVRMQNGVRATENGLELRRRIEPILSEMDAIQTSMRESAHHGNVRIGVTPLTNVMFLAPLIVDFARRYPSIRISWFEGGTERIRHKLLAGELDFGLALDSCGEEELTSLPLVRDEMVVYLHEKNPLSGRSTLTFEDLKNETFNLCDTTFAITAQVFSRCHAANFSPRVNIAGSRVLFLMQLAALNTGICILPRPYCSIFAQEHTKMIPIEGYPWVESLLLPKNTFFSDDAKTASEYFLGAFQEISKELAASKDKNPHHLPYLKKLSAVE